MEEAVASMSVFRKTLGLALTPIRWLLAELGSTLFGLGVFIAVLVLTGLAEGSAWKALLFLTPLVVLLVTLALRRRGHGG